MIGSLGSYVKIKAVQFKHPPLQSDSQHMKGPLLWRTWLSKQLKVEISWLLASYPNTQCMIYIYLHLGCLGNKCMVNMPYIDHLGFIIESNWWEYPRQKQLQYIYITVEWNNLELNQSGFQFISPSPTGPSASVRGAASLALQCWKSNMAV